MKRKSLILSIVLLTLFILAVGKFWIKKPSSKIDQIMNADKGFKFPSGFPPDPGEAGKKTLEGIDSDHDGLRDDVQRWIYARFPNEPKKRAALRQKAISYQNMLSLKYDHKEIEQANIMGEKASRCLFDSFLDPSEAYNEGRFIEAKMLNTKRRITRYLEVDGWFNGTTSQSYPKDGTACEK